MKAVKIKVKTTKNHDMEFLKMLTEVNKNKALSILEKLKKKLTEYKILLIDFIKIFEDYKKIYLQIKLTGEKLITMIDDFIHTDFEINDKYKNIIEIFKNQLFLEINTTKKTLDNISCIIDSEDFLLTSWKPISPISFCAKMIMENYINNDDVKKIISSLKLTLNITTDIEQIICEPLIDKEEMLKSIKYILDVITSKIGRCDEAVNILLNSTSIFSDNYEKYYKEFIISDNSQVFLTSFMSDIIHDTKIKKKLHSKLTIRSQLRKIITLLRDKIKESGLLNENVSDAIDALITELSNV